jgi:hypothetical protein
MLKLPWSKETDAKSNGPQKLSIVDGPQKTALVTEDKEFALQYDTLASELGVQRRVYSKLKEVLEELSIQAYDQAAVERYMDEKGYWSWYPLRGVDNYSWIEGFTRETSNAHPALYGSVSRAQYDKQVPYPVLMTVKSLVDKMGDDVLFFVAAIASHPDPFLAVMQRSAQGKIFIVERWAEPSFRG